MSDTLGNQIATDITLADSILSPFITALNPVVGQGVHLALKLLAVAEPAVFAAVVAALQGTPLTPEQETEKAAAITRLQNPQQYFA